MSERCGLEEYIANTRRRTCSSHNRAGKLNFNALRVPYSLLYDVYRYNNHDQDISHILWTKFYMYRRDLTTASLFLSLAFSFTRTLHLSHMRELSFFFFYETQKIKIRKTFYTSPILIYLENGLAISPNGQTVDFLCLAVTGRSGSKDPPLGGVQQCITLKR